MSARQGDYAPLTRWGSEGTTIVGGGGDRTGSGWVGPVSKLLRNKVSIIKPEKKRG